jgi:hypothetical protein
MPAQITKPVSDSRKRRTQRALSVSLRWRHQYRHRPNSETAKVRNTESEYSTTSSVTWPRVQNRIASAAMPITRMPFCVTRRVDR